MILVKRCGNVMRPSSVHEGHYGVEEIKEYVGGAFKCLSEKKIGGLWYRVIVAEDQTGESNMVASRMAGRLVCGDVLFLLKGGEIS